MVTQPRGNLVDCNLLRAYLLLRLSPISGRSNVVSVFTGQYFLNAITSRSAPRASKATIALNGFPRWYAHGALSRVSSNENRGLDSVESSPPFLPRVGSQQPTPMQSPSALASTLNGSQSLDRNNAEGYILLLSIRSAEIRVKILMYRVTVCKAPCLWREQ